MTILKHYTAILTNKANEFSILSNKYTEKTNELKVRVRKLWGSFSKGSFPYMKMNFPIDISSTI